MKNNFIELTNLEDAKILVNIPNIIWIQPYEDGTQLMINFSYNNYPFSINVMEDYNKVKSLIGF